MIFVSLLRGINVGGHHKIKMAELKVLYASLGFTEVESYIQSGNVVFKADGHSASDLQAMLSGEIEAAFGFPVPVIVRTAAEFAQLIAANPFGAINPDSEGSLYYIIFLGQAPSSDGLAALKALARASEKIMAVGREVYLHCPEGFARTKLSGANLDKHLGSGATARNWRTVHKVAELVRGPIDTREK